MTDLPISQSQPANGTAKVAAAVAGLIALFRTTSSALAQATARNAQRKAMRRAPEEILAAQARREEARRAVDRLWLLR
jgi:hypothetical protein